MMRNYNCNKDDNESVYFYTLHKCASTLFAGFVLQNINGFEHVDYASQIYTGKISGKQLNFEKKGYIYGPIRISVNISSPVRKYLILPTTNGEFIKNKRAIFFIRDPRDILVSSYYSFGFTHGFSSVENIRKVQERDRRDIQKQSLDEYVLKSAKLQVKYFNSIYNLANICEYSIILKYEDMVNDFDGFIEHLCNFVPIDDSIVEKIYLKSRPQEKENMSSHRRSGQVNGFRGKLQEETVKTLNAKLEHILNLFEYEL